MTHQSELNLLMNQTRKEIRPLDRNSSLAVDLHCMAPRQAERALAMDARSRHANFGVALAADPHSIPRPKSSTGLQVRPHRSSLASALSTASPEYREIIQLRNELTQLRFEHKQLQELMSKRIRIAEADQKKHDAEKKILVAMIRNLKDEVEGGWKRISRLKESYEGPAVSNTFWFIRRNTFLLRDVSTTKPVSLSQPDIS